MYLFVVDYSSKTQTGVGYSEMNMQRYFYKKKYCRLHLHAPEPEPGLAGRLCAGRRQGGAHGRPGQPRQEGVQGGDKKYHKKNYFKKTEIPFVPYTILLFPFPSQIRNIVFLFIFNPTI